MRYTNSRIGLLKLYRTYSRIGLLKPIETYGRIGLLRTYGKLTVVLVIGVPKSELVTVNLCKVCSRKLNRQEQVKKEVVIDLT